MVKRALSYRDPEQDRISAVRFVGYSGLVPFWALVIFQFLEGGLSEDAVWAAEMAVVVYGAVIVGFMGGGRWVFQLLDQSETRSSLVGAFFLATLPPLLAWMIASAPDIVAGVLFTPMVRALLIGLILALQLVQDLLHERMMPVWYLNLRIQLTAGAAGALWLSALLNWLL